MKLVVVADVVVTATVALQKLQLLINYSLLEHEASC
jgi:hypothetical protein